ncbi:M1 family aminopeptidase [Amycolatopsis sp. H20-H5]|uniref:M1 family aminopeptidase n=1 Tax=Amycolatopsis sp. H20-H5 TaxID=3046309 RepID=UPI003FA3D4FB
MCRSQLHSNECFASYSPWLWSEAKDGVNLNDRYRAAIEITQRSTDFWAQKLTDMGAGNEFGGVYNKGILAMHALRRKVGEAAFAEVLRGWPAEHRHGNASWAEFETFVSHTAGQDLHAFFDDWFRGTKLPADADLHPGALRT